MKRPIIIISFTTVLILFIIFAILSRASDLTRVNNSETSDIDLEECCDESCIENICTMRINEIYNDCGFHILNVDIGLSVEEAKDFCMEGGRWKCFAKAESPGCDTSCNENLEDIETNCTDEYFEPEEICGSIERYLRQKCQVELSGGYSFDDDESDGLCGCGM